MSTSPSANIRIDGNIADTSSIKKGPNRWKTAPDSLLLISLTDPRAMAEARRRGLSFGCEACNYTSSDAYTVAVINEQTGICPSCSTEASF